MSVNASTMKWWVVAMVVVVARSSTALASVPDASGVIHGCYDNKTGIARIIDTATQACFAKEAAITWSQTGPVGPQGPVGATGPQGPAGQSVIGSSVNVGNPNCPYGGTALTLGVFTTYVCNGTPGTPGAQGPQGATGPQGPQGPSGIALAGRETIFGGTPAQSSSSLLTGTNQFTPTHNTTCIISAGGYMVTASDNPDVTFVPVLRDLTDNDDTDDTEAFYRVNGAGDAQGSTTTGLDVLANHTYSIAIRVHVHADPAAAGNFTSTTVTWLCP